MKVTELLKRLEAEFRASAKWWNERTHDPHNIAQGLAVAYGGLSTICEKILGEHMEQIGRKGGRKTSIAKVESAAANAKLGGRPLGSKDSAPRAKETKPRKPYKKRLTPPPESK